MRFLNGFSFDDGKRTRKANRGAQDNETSGNGGREGGRAIFTGRLKNRGKN